MRIKIASNTIMHKREMIHPFKMMGCKKINFSLMPYKTNRFQYYL